MLRTLRSRNQYILLIVDGWNESGPSLARKIDRDAELLHQRSVRLLISFTSSSSSRLLRDDLGNPTYIEDSALNNSGEHQLLEVSPDKLPKEWAVANLAHYDTIECSQAYQRYSTEFRVRIPDGHEFTRDPFLLRIAMQAFAGKQLPINLDEPALIERSLSTKELRVKGLRPEQTRAYVLNLAMSIIKHGAPVSYANFFTDTFQPATAEVPDGLFEAAIFARAQVTQGEMAFDFYSQGERNFVLAFWTSKWLKRLRSQDVPLHSLRLDSEPLLQAFTWFLSCQDNTDLFNRLSRELDLRCDNSAWRSLLTAATMIAKKSSRLPDGVSETFGLLIDKSLQNSDPLIGVQSIGLLPYLDRNSAEQFIYDIADDNSLLTAVLKLDNHFPFASSNFGKAVLSALSELHGQFATEDDSSDIGKALVELTQASNTVLRAAACRCLGYISPWAFSRQISSLRFALASEGPYPDYLIEAMKLTTHRLGSFLYGDMCPGLLQSLEDCPGAARFYYSQLSHLAVATSQIRDPRLTELRQMFKALRDLTEDPDSIDDGHETSFFLFDPRQLWLFPAKTLGGGER